MKITIVLIRRFVRLFLTVFAASTALFFLLRVVPGDPARIIAGIDGGANEEVVASIRRDLELDKPLIIQYGDWLLATISLDFGDSWQRSLPVNQLLAERLGITLFLAFLAMGISLIVAFPMGIVSAVRHDSVSDHILMGTSHVLLAIPEFWLGILLLFFFSVYLPIFPLFGSSSPGHFLLPALALGLGRAAFLSRLVRSAVLRELQRDYVFFFAHLGLPRRRIILRHVLPNAMIPTAIPAGIQFGYLLGGAIIIEQVFSMGGTGRLLLQAIQTRDFPLIQGAVILLAIIFSLVNLLADIIAVLADPQSRI